MQDNYFKFCQTSFKDVYSLTLRKSLYLWLFPELVATMNHASGKKTIGGISSHRPQVFPCVIPCMYTQEHVKHLLQSLSNKTSSVFKSNVHQGNPKWWTKFNIHRVLFCLCLQDEDKIYHRWSLHSDHRAVSFTSLSNVFSFKTKMQAFLLK